MRNKLVFLIAGAFLLPWYAFAQTSEIDIQKNQLLNKANRNFFIENKGQWPAEVLYLARLGGMNAWITNTGVVYDYFLITKDYKPEETMKMPRHENDMFEFEHTSIKGQVVEMLLEGANKDAKTQPSGIQEGYYNYFIGNDTTKWASFVRLYTEVLVQDLYPGIDIRYYFDNGLIRYDYIAKPGADLAKINLKIVGSDDYTINDKGELTLKTSLGEITHGKLFAYQQDGKYKTEITCTFTKNNNGTIGFYAENYNPALALVIDPLVYSTFVGGSAAMNLYDEGYSIAIDASGNSYNTGSTGSTAFPTTSGAYDVSHNGNYDVFVTKLNISGSALVYSTFLGGSGDDYGYSITLDTFGNSYITGYCDTLFPITSGAFDVSFNGYYDVFVVKLNSTGSALVYSTFIGGSGSDKAFSITLDGTGNSYITGFSSSTLYPTTSGAYDVSFNGSIDVFVTKLNSSGSALIYSTFIGGSSSDYGRSIKVDTGGYAYITGYTYSTTYPTTSGAYDVSQNGGYDVFITKLNNSGSALVYSTFIGGSASEEAYSIALDGSGNSYVTGYTDYTSSVNYPTTSGAYDVSHNGNDDVFVTKLNSSGSALVYSTYIGCGTDETGYSIAIDGAGNAYITGYTEYTLFNAYPTTSGAYDVGHNGNDDVFVTKLNSSGSALVYSTFLGGSANDYGYSITPDGTGNSYITGFTYSSTYPTTSGAHDVSFNSGCDLFVTKILLINQSSNISVIGTSNSGPILNWTKGDGIRRVVFVKQTSSGSAIPVNGISYTANDTFGKGTQIGTSGWYCVYNDTGSTFTLKGLTTNNTYRIMVCEYIGSSGNWNYITDVATNNPISFTYNIPSQQASNITFSGITSTGFSISCTKGNGYKRAIFIKDASYGLAIPEYGISYAGNAKFGYGTQIGNTGWYCVYNDTGRTVNVINLTPNTIFRVMVCEYNGYYPQYNIDSLSSNPVNQKTDIATSTAPTIQASTLIYSQLSTTSIYASWIKGNGSERIVFIRATTSGSPAPSTNTTYLANDTLGKGSQIGTTGWYCVYKGTSNTCTIKGLTPNTSYRMMVIEYNGGASAEKYMTTTSTNNPRNYYPVPSVQSSNLVFSNITSTSFTVSCTPGNGSSRIAFIKHGSTTGSAIPVNNTTYYWDSYYPYGDEIGTSYWYCVYKGTGSSITIYDCPSSSSIYNIMFCEYNGTTGEEIYNITSGTNNPKWTNLVPSIQATNISFSTLSSSSISLSWTKGNGNKRVVFIKDTTSGTPSPVNDITYTANDTFGKGSQIGSSGWYCVYNGNGSTTSIKGLPYRTCWSVLVCEYNGEAGNEKYKISTATNNPGYYYSVPTINAKNITFSTYGTTSFTANWTKGNGTYRNVFICAGNSGTPSPVENTSYSASTVFGTGTQIGTTGWYCVYNGTGTSVSVTGLTSNTTYRLMVCERNGYNYNITPDTNNPRNYYPVPTSQASNIQFTSLSSTSCDVSWTNGNGSKRIVFAFQGNSGTPSPTNYLTYTANTVFGSGTQIGSTGWYCIFNGTGNSVSLTGLTSNTTYRVKVIEYNGIAGEEVYSTSSGTNNPTNYYPVPTTQAQNITFSNYNSSSFTASWTSGSGTARAVFLYAGSTGSASPVNKTTYNANSTFGLGTQIGTSGWYCIYNGTGTSLNVSGLIANTTYRIMICEYHGISGAEQYNITASANNPKIYYPVPTSQTFDLQFSSVTSTSMNVSWTNGNGTKRAVFIFKGNSGTVSPVIYTTYSANTVFGSGTQVGTSGWYCVYNSTGTSVNISGLTTNTTYRVMACEYNGTAGEEVYNTTNAANNPSNQTTDYAAPSSQANSIVISSVTSSEVTLSWTRGNGSNVAAFIYQGNSGSVSPVDNTTYSASTTFGSGTQVGSTGWYCIYNSTGNSVSITGLSPNTTYRLMICEYNGVPGKEKYNKNTSTNNPYNQKTKYSVPVTQAYSISFNIITASSMSISWSSGDGSRRAVFMLQGNSGAVVPVNNITYSASNTFGSGSQVGSSGWYCIYNGSGNSVSVSGLNANTIYRVMVCEYNGTLGEEVYNTSNATDNPLNQITDFSVPLIQASGIKFSNISSNGFKVNWTRGDGNNAAVFIYEGSSGNAAPDNNFSYTASSVFGLGSQIGSSGWFCIYNNSGDSVNVTGLTPNKTYRVMICEYNGIGGKEKYNNNTGTENPSNQTTRELTPSIQASNLTFSDITPNSVKLKWTKGNGNKRIVFAKQANSGNAIPQNDITYIADSFFGNGSQIGSSEWYCIYNGVDDEVTLQNLLYNKTYRFMVIEYNGTSGFEQYNLSSNSNNPANITTMLEAQPVCIATVDTITWKNKVIWEKKQPQGPVTGYKIYKEISTNTYSLIGNVLYNDHPAFVDLTSNPDAHGDKYKITAYDSNYLESTKSNYHKTMNLTMSKNGNTMGLRWDPYEDEGGLFVPAKYLIYRGSTPSNMSLLDSISGSFTSYNDNNVFSVYYYLVGVMKEDGCNEYRGNEPVKSFSNKIDNSKLIGVQENTQKFSLLIFPNPFTESTTVKLDDFYASQGYTYTLLDCTGKALIHRANQTAPEFIIEKGELKKGIYFIEIDGIAKLKGKVMVVE